jgi:hypothetical protein
LKLSIADSIIYASIILATAQAHEAVLWTQNAHFKGMDGVRFIEKKT